MQDNISSTLIVSHAVRPGKTDDFAQWIEEVSDVAKRAPGFCGIVRLGQTNALRHLLLRFTSRDDLERFRAGDRYQLLERRARDLTIGIDQVADGRDVDIELPSDASVARWKRFLVTWLSVLPVLLIVSTTIRALLPTVPPPVQVIVSSLCLTSLLQWVILPRVQRAARAWMLKDAAGRLRT